LKRLPGKMRVRASFLLSTVIVAGCAGGRSTDVASPAALTRPGDLNGDGVVNALDLATMTNDILKGVYSAAADLNHDNAVNALDLQQLVNFILHPPACTTHRFVLAGASTSDTSGGATLYSFDSGSLALTKIGAVSCPGETGPPRSMAIDASGTAWVNYLDGALFKVSTKDGSCTAPTPAFVPNQNGFLNFGMAFVNVGGTETLFVSGVTAAFAGVGLGKIDLSTMTLSTVADYPGTLAGQPVELSSTSDGKLYGLFGTAPAVLAQIDPATAATSNAVTLPTTIDIHDATDLALLADTSGSWIFVANTTTNASATSAAWFQSSSGATTEPMANVGFIVDGAGDYISCP
jgi:hypothetical protein